MQFFTARLLFLFIALCRRKWRMAAALSPVVIVCVATASEIPPPPLQRAQYQRISRAAEISADLDALVAASPLARKERVGLSVQQRPIEALLLSSVSDGARTRHPRVMLVGSQHGAAEPAGGEAMLLLARQLLNGDLRGVLNDFDVVLLPDANPDGRDSGHRSNAAEVNLNTDFVRLSQPESQALLSALARYQPVAVLDVHESAILKRKTLAREGYLTDFDAQFEAANNPALPSALRDYGQQSLLPLLIAQARQRGLPAQRYIGEITSIHQPISNGGLSLRNFRNRAAMSGTLSFLVETKLDSRDDPWPTFRNIEARVVRSLSCQRSFLEVLQRERLAVLRTVEAARVAAQKEPIMLYANYAEDLAHPRVELVLRRLADRELATLTFADHRHVTTADEISMPATYVVSQPDDALRAALERHGIQYERQSQSFELPVVAERFAPAAAAERTKLLSSTDKFITTAPGALLIDLVQRHGRLVPLLLDPRSPSSLFRLPEFAAALRADQDFGIYRIHKGVMRGAPRLE
jgi:hypothetical protein